MNCEDRPPKPDPGADLFEVCPVARAFEVFGSKWRLAVLRSLILYGEQRFSELQRTTTADSATLSRVLADLEDRELVDRRLEDRPIATYYDLTDSGESLTAVFEAFEEWAFEHVDLETPAAPVSE